MNFECYNMDYERIIDVFEKKYNSSCIMLIRLHPNIAALSNKLNYNERIINASSYPDLYELIIASTAIISDYSSLSFEAGLLNKPVFLYAKDLDKYMENRGFLINPFDQPYILTQSEEELVSAIEDFDEGKYQHELAIFNNSLGIKESGMASKIIADKIMSVIQLD